jgi:HAD superfamily hydrolase (TIGR01509 family)
MLKAILFDRDGVIIDTEPINIRAGFEAFRKLGVELSQTDIQKIVGRNSIDYVTDLRKTYDFSQERFQSIQRELFYKYFETIAVFKDIVKLIKNLKVEKFKLGLTTSAGMESTEKVLEITKLENIFDAIVTKESCEQRKPNPEPYLNTAKLLKLDVCECLVIEDSQVGLEAAKNAGMKCVVIPNDSTKHQNFNKADFVVKNADEILIVINNF